MSLSYTNDLHKPSDVFGGNVPMADRATRKWELATIITSYPNTNTYDVQAQRHGRLKGIPCLLRSAGESQVLPLNTTVVIHDELGFFVIDAVLPFTPTNTVEQAPLRISEVEGIGGEDTVRSLQKSSTTFHDANAPVDLLEGDHITMSPDGNMIGVLAGGTNVMKSSSLAQIRTHSVQDLVEIISANYKHITSMGDTNIINDGGHTSLKWRAAAHQSQNGGGSEDWTLRLDVGASGDMFNFEVTTPQGATLAKLHISAAGKIEFIAVDGFDITSAGGYREDISENKVSNIDGNLTQTVIGDEVTTTQGSETKQVFGNVSETYGGNQGVVVANNINNFVGGSDVSLIQAGTGGAGVVAKKTQTINGGVLLDVGSPLIGALPSGQGVDVVNHTGATNFVTMPTSTGGFNVITTLPASVKLGATGTAVPNTATGGYTITSVAPFSAAMYEPLVILLSALLTWCDTHTHLTAFGPTSIPVVLATPIVQPLEAAIKSSRVAIGA